MPELPEVETVCRGLEPSLTGQVIDYIDQRRPNLRIPFPDNLPKTLKGQTITAIKRRAKYILMTLSNDMTLILHLGMSGKMVIHNDGLLKQNIEKHDHLIFYIQNGVVVTFNDPRRFGLVDICPTDTLDEHRFFIHLGPEPLGNDFNAPLLYAKIKGKKSNIKNTLLDQRIVCGLGNIYVCEALFHAHIAPTRICNTITKPETETLTTCIRDVLNKAIAAGGSSLKNYVQATGELGYFQHSWAVYGREGDPCHADEAHEIKRVVQSGRSSFYCPSCQK